MGDFPSKEPDPVEPTERPHRRGDHNMAFPPDLKPVNSLSNMERLPAELYMALLQHVTPTDGVLLSLTCKSLWAQVTLQSNDVLDKLKRTSSLDEILHFLKLLEKDDSSYTMCTFCFRLHSRSRHEHTTLIQTRESITKRRPCSEQLGVLRLTGPYECRLVIYREAVDLLLRAATLGAEFGLQLDCMRQSFEREVYSTARMDIRFKCNAVTVPVPESEQSPHLFIETAYTVELDLRRSLYAQVKGAEIAR